MGNSFSAESLSCDQLVQRFLPSLCGKWKYVYNLEDNLEALYQEKQDLNALRNNLEERISKEEDRGLQRLQEVIGWISMVEEIERKANGLLDKSVSEIQKLSMYGYCFGNSASTYDYSEDVVMTLKNVEALKSHAVFEVVVDRALPPLVKRARIQLTVSQEKLLERAWDFLKDKNALGIYGRGGVGKTTILTQIKNKFLEARDAFGLVIFIAVSSQEVESIQEQICNRLGLQWRRETKKEKVAETLKVLLKGKRFVLLLDGIQREVDLEKIGVPFPSRENGCKIVFTTRSEEACQSKWVNSMLKVSCLSPDEAWELFQNTVGENTLTSHPDIPKLARVVASTCRGLPLALDLIGESMARKRTVHEWRYTIHLLASSAAEFSDMEDESLPNLKSIYDLMNGENIRLCFLYCALFPQNCDIRKENLVDYWIGEGIIATEDRERAETQGYEMIGDLVRMRLLVEDKSGYCVKMHDIVREMALWIASDFGRQKERFVVGGPERIHEMRKINGWGMVRMMSMTSTQIENFSDSPGCSELTTLILKENYNLKWISNDFFRWMTSLVVLDLSSNGRLSKLPEGVSSLVSLQFLNLSWTWINRLPLGLKKLKKLIHLDLDYTSNLKDIDVIASLWNLQVLRLLGSVALDRSLLVDIQQLKCLKELSVIVVEDSVFMWLLSIRRLAGCIRRLGLKYITITDGVIALLNAMFSLRELDMLGCNIPETIIDWRSTTIPMRMIPQFRNMRKVSLHGCNGLRDLTWLLVAPSLDDLTLSKCPQIEQVISKEKAMAQQGHMSEQPFQNLTRLSLNDLPKLESIYWTPLPFPVLEDITISHCPKLRRFSFNSESAKGNQLRLYLDKEWIKGVQWEDEATKQRFSGFNNRDFSEMAKEQKMDGLASELDPIQNKVLVRTTEKEESVTTSSSSGKKMLQPETHTTGVTISNTIDEELSQNLVKRLEAVEKEVENIQSKASLLDVSMSECQSLSTYDDISQITPYTYRVFTPDGLKSDTIVEWIKGIETDDESMDFNDEWTKRVEWEDEATNQRFSDFKHRDFAQMAEDKNVDDFASELHPTQNRVLVETTQSGERATPGSVSGEKVLQSETHVTDVTMERTQTYGASTSEGLISNTIDGGERRESTMTDAFGGATVSQALKFVIVEARKVLVFDKVSKDLAWVMESILPIITEIELVPNVGELKNLKNTILLAHMVVGKCSVVKRWDLLNRKKYTREVEEISKDLLKFCQVELQLLMLRNQVQPSFLMEENDNNFLMVNKKLDLLSAFPSVFRDLCSVPKLDRVPVGFDRPLWEIKRKILVDSVDSLVVSAPPGIGKTTLVTHLCHDAEIKGKFKHIFFMVVSSAPDFHVLVQNLFQHNGYAPFTFENDSQATDGLGKLLTNLIEDGPILLVLDDVWLGAESLLYKFRINIPDYKILVTSRFDFPSFGSTFHMKPLSDEDAKTLLIQWAPRPDHAPQAEYEDLLRKILERCSGFPLLIEVVAGSLKGQSLTSWKGQVLSWSKDKTVLDNPRVSVLETLHRSLNVLSPHLKECFLDMGLFLEDQYIRASVIIDIWVQFYDKGSIMCMKYLENLASQNLLKLTPLGRYEHEYTFYNEVLVTQHNILRDLAIHYNNLEAIQVRKRLNLDIKDDIFPDWCLNPGHPIINASLLSIYTDDLFSSSWVEIDCPNVEALILNLSSSNYALPKFIATMKNLKVVIIINHGPTVAVLTNLSCLIPLPNLKRIRLENVSITLLDILQLQLHSAKKLSLFRCSSGKVSHDTRGIDVSKALLSLQELEIDYCSDLVELPSWVSEVISLKTLSITNCNKLTRLPEAIGNLSKLEVLRLNSCTSLSEFPETTERLSNLQFLDISDCEGLRKLPLEIGNLRKLKKISMRKCWTCEIPNSVSKLENLEVKCDEETASLWKSLNPKMKNLEVHLEEIEYNRSLTSSQGQEIIWSKGGTVLDNPHPNVLDCLQPSFNALKSHLKECFLDMGLFLEDQKIHASIIIDIWVESYGKDSILCMEYLKDLASENLIALVPIGKNESEYGFYNEFLVTQHDILRELAIRQSESEAILNRKRLNLEIHEGNFPDWCLNLSQPINAHLLSISTDDLFSSTWVEMDCPNVEVLVLNLSSWKYALPSFIDGMLKLKVLIVTNHGFKSAARLSNFLCLSSLPNLKRIRLEKVSLTLLDIPQLQLGSLKKLSLVMCSFHEVFYDGIEEIHVSKRLPSLQEIEIDYCYDLVELPHWISEVDSLEILSITNCNKLTRLPEAIGNLSQLEVLRLSSCINLPELPKTTERLSSLQFLDISDCLGLRKLPLEIGNLWKLKKISMRKCWRCELPDSVTRLENLEVRCDEETALLWKRLEPKMKTIFIMVEETDYNLNMFNMF